MRYLQSFKNVIILIALFPLWTYEIPIQKYEIYIKYVYNVPFEEEILYYCKRYNVEPEFIMAIIKIESNFNKYARSNRNAIGLMQIQYDHAIKLGGIRNYYNEHNNLEIGIKWLAYLIERYGNDYSKIAKYYYLGETLYEKLKNSNEAIDYAIKVLENMRKINNNKREIVKFYIKEDV